MQTQCSSTSSSCCERVNKLGINISRRPVTLVRSSASYTTPSSPMAETAGIKAVPALPATFKRLVAKTSGNSFTEVAQVVEMPMVMPGPGEVLIKITYAGINGGCETFRVRGEHWFADNAGKATFPLGAEGVGIITALGPDVTNFQIGEPVACNSAAAFAEYTIAKAMMCTKLQAAGPEEVAVMLSGLTACASLEGTAHMAAGETVLVTAASGGTGQFAVQLAKLAGCRVVATCGGPAKAQVLREQLGADVVIDYKAQDMDVALAAACPDGVHVVYEGVGGAIRATALKHLAPNGRLLQIGYISEYPHTYQDETFKTHGSPQQTSPQHPSDTVSSSGQDAHSTTSSSDGAAVAGLPTCAEMFWGRQNIQRGEQQIIGAIWPKDPKAIMKAKKRVFDLYYSGQLQALTDQGHGLHGVDGIPGAVQYMLQGGHVGKVVIKIGDPPAL